MPIEHTEKILVTGGAGYIGSHMVAVLKEAGYEPVVLDNLSKGHADAVLDAELVVGDIHDRALLSELFAKHEFIAVMHFAGLIDVAESIKFPIKYYHENVAGTATLLEAVHEAGVLNFIFSSSAAVYGEPLYTPIDEQHPIVPLTPYGRSKWMAEEIIKDLAKTSSLHYAVLRYFNAAGNDPERALAERHEPETHLIPLIIQAAIGKHAVQVHGAEYPTPDDTCIRDYVHVLDICRAHLAALESLRKGKKAIICNLGSGCGYSVKEVIQTAKQISECAILCELCAPRLGDPIRLIASIELAKTLLDWQPRYTLNEIINHAWQYYHSIHLYEEN